MSSVPASETYPRLVGAIYVYNLIVGIGSLTLPSVFSKTGWGLSFISLFILTFMGYVTVTFVLESMSYANAMLKLENSGITDRGNISNNLAAIKNGETYSLDVAVEYGRMSQIFFGKVGRFLFYLAICAYLYGNLSIYIVAITKTLTDLSCEEKSADYDKLCWKSSKMTKMTMYRLMIMSFVLLVGPFSYFKINKTKYLQIFTSTLRWCAFTLMIGLGIGRIATNGAQGNPPFADFKSIPELIGACVYAFMCHHSLPSLIAPFSSKSHIYLVLIIDQMLIYLFYLLLGMTGCFAFETPRDLYTLNFVAETSDKNIGWPMQVASYFLGLFPVFTLSTTFPIICITLHNNLSNLFIDPREKENYNFVVRRLIFPTMALIPPTIIALITYNIRTLVAIIGTYGGSAIQYVIPTCLVYYSRKASKELFGDEVNAYKSPFQGLFWICCIIIWSIFCVILASTNLVWKYFM